MEKKYRPRIADKLLAFKLEGKGAVLIEGAKWCGKTTTAEQIAQSVLYMTQSGMLERNKQMATMHPEVLLRGKNPRLIDEWQIAPELWDSIRFESDHAGRFGLFILTGSAVPADMSKVFHSGTGRFGWLRMRPMSLWESGDSTGEVSLGGLFSGETDIAGVSRHDLAAIAYLASRGGWPQTLKMKKEVALEQAFDYVAAIENRDLEMADGVTRDPVMIHKMLRSLSRLQGAQANHATIRADLLANESDSLTEETIARYLKALKSIFVTEDAEAWNPNLRSKTAIRTSDTRYFTDPSIAVAALGLGPNDLMNDLETFGLVFETLCVRDMRVYAEALNGTVYHYRDKNGLECDAVIHLRNGSYGLVEVKLGGEKWINAGAETLLKLADKIDTGRMKSPSFLMVLTAAGTYAYRRPDGVLVVPIGCLKD